MCICLDFMISGLCIVPFGVCACQFVKVCPPLPPKSVRRVALVSFNSAAPNKPVLIADLLDSLLPILYRETIVRVSDTHAHTHTSSVRLAWVLFPRPTDCQIGELARPTPDKPGVSGCRAPWP